MSSSVPQPLTLTPEAPVPFAAHLGLAALAIALKRRVIILQAVEHAQMDSGNPFENFVRALKADQHRLDKLEPDIDSVLVRVSALELTRSHRLKDLVVTPGDVDRLLRASHRMQELGNGVEVNSRVSDVAIEVARSRDGSLIVFPAAPECGVAGWPRYWRPVMRQAAAEGRPEVAIQACRAFAEAGVPAGADVPAGMLAALDDVICWWP